MNGFSILMFIFSLAIFLVGLYMFTGHKLGILTERVAFKNLNINEWKNIGKWTMITSIIPLILAVVGIIFNFEIISTAIPLT